MIEGHDCAVIRRPLVCAHTEHGANVAAHFHEEAAGGTGVAWAATRLRTSLRLIPALRGLAAPLLRQDAGATKTQVAHNRQVRIVARILKALFQAHIVRHVGQRVLT